MDEGDCADTGGGVATGAVFAQAAFHRAQQDAQHGTLQGGVSLQKIAQALGHGKHPLPHRQTGKDLVGRMRGGLGHAPRVARRAHAPPFTGKGDEEVVPALVAMGAGEAVG